MNCTAINSNQIETTPNNHPRLAGTTPGSRSAGTAAGPGGSTPATVFFHHTNNLHDAHRIPAATSSEEENSPTELNSCRRLTEKPPLVKRLTMGILRTAEDSRPLVHSSSSPSSSSSSSQTFSDGYVNEGICGDTAETSIGNGGSGNFSNSGHSSSGGGIGTKMVDRLLPSTVANGTGPDHGTMPPNRYNHSAALYPPAVPIRNDSLSLKEQHELKGAPWFQAGIPREISLEVLSRQCPGAFLVRQSTTKPGCFALSLRVPPPAPKVAHYLILRTIRGYKIKGFTKEFSSLRALITHHSVMPELLPVPLALPRPSVGHRHEDPDTYGCLNDFQNIITE